MDRLTTDTPKTNLESALNLFYAKDGEAWVLDGGPGPDYQDVSLFDFARRIIKAHAPHMDVALDNDELSEMMAEWLFDGPDSIEGLIATLYTAAWAFAELRCKLAAYEDTGYTPAEINDLVLKIATLETIEAMYDGRLVGYLPGDTVYDRFGMAWTVTASEIHKFGDGPLRYLYRCGHPGTDDYCALYSNEILTREEAEAALKGGDEG